MTTDRHATIGAMLDEYALGQLSQTDRRDVEAHVRECELCSADLRELTVVMEALAYSPDPVTPPPALKQRVLSSLASLPQEPPRSAPESNVVALPSRDAVIRRGVHPGWLAAAALVILAFVVDDVQEAQAATAEAQATVVELRSQLDLNAKQADLVVSILTARDMRPIEMSGQENATASAARAYWSPTRGLLIAADNLPVPPPGRIYQVWVIGGGGPMSAGLLGEQGSARGLLIAPPPAGAAPGTVTVAVTDEPPGGLPAPTGTIRLAGKS
jgi:anti-sigma-K factor RskA